MNAPDHEDLRALWDAYLDGDLGPEDEARVREHIKSSPDAWEQLESDLALGDALRRHFVETGRRSVARTSATALPFRRRWVAASAAAAILLAIGLGFSAGRLTGDSSKDRALEGPVTPPPSRSQEAFTPSAGASFDATSDAGDSLRLRRGAVRLHPVKGTATVAMEEAEVRVTGAADLYRAPAATEEGEGHALLTVHVGSASVKLASGVDAVAVEAGESVVLVKDEVIPVRDLLGAQRAPSEDWIATSPFTEEEENDLQQRMTELLAENRRLKLEAEALRLREGGSKALTTTELFKAVAKEVASNDMAKEETWRRASGSMRALLRKLRDRKTEALALLEKVLAGAEANVQERALALRLLGRFANAELLELAEPYLNHPESSLRGAAVHTLSRRPESTFRTQLSDVFRRTGEETHIRVSAAGGLIRLGDQGEPLEWLMQTYREAQDEPALRGRILGWVIFAPIDRTAEFLIEAARDERISRRRMRGLIDSLSWRGGIKAESVLESLSESLKNETLRAHAKSALARVRSEN